MPSGQGAKLQWDEGSWCRHGVLTVLVVVVMSVHSGDECSGNRAAARSEAPPAAGAVCTAVRPHVL